LSRVPIAYLLTINKRYAMRTLRKQYTMRTLQMGSAKISMLKKTGKYEF